LYMHDLREPHLAALKRILRYIRGTLHLGLLLRPSSSTEMVVYSDADWAGCPDTRKSTSGFAVFLGDNLVSWSSKRQQTVSRSSALLPMLLQRLLGCASFSRNFMLLSVEPSWSIVTTSALCTCPPTPFNINAPSTSRSTSTSFASGLPLVMFVFFMCRPHHSMPTSSPRASLHRSSLSSGPV